MHPSFASGSGSSRLQIRQTHYQASANGDINSMSSVFPQKEGH